MEKQLSTDIKKYLKDVKLMLPIHSKEEKKFLENLSNSIYDMAYTDTNININNIIEQFGAPKEVVNNYISELDTNRLCKSLKTRTILKRAVALILLLVIFLFACRIYILEKAYKDFQNTIVTQETVVIE